MGRPARASLTCLRQPRLLILLLPLLSGSCQNLKHTKLPCARLLRSCGNSLKLVFKGISFSTKKKTSWGEGGFQRSSNYRIMPVLSLSCHPLPRNNTCDCSVDGRKDMAEPEGDGEKKFDKTCCFSLFLHLAAHLLPFLPGTIKQIPTREAGPWTVFFAGK